MCGCLQPICELFFAHASAGNCHHGLIVINLGGRRLQVIELKKGNSNSILRFPNLANIGIDFFLAVWYNLAYLIDTF